MKKTQPIHFTTLVLSGGAFKGAMFLGFLSYLEELKMLKNFNTFIGSSSGSIVSFLMAIGFTVQESFYATQEGARAYIDRPLDIDNIINIVQTMGVDNGDGFQSWLQDCLFKKLGQRDITFIDFAKSFGKNLIICASNLSTKEVHYFSVDDTPHVSVIQAIRASISVPFVFTPVTIDGHLFVDAILLNNFPMEKSYRSGLKDTLGLVLTSDDYVPQSLNLFTYVRLMIESLLIKVNTKPQDLLQCQSNVIIELYDSTSNEINIETCKINIQIEDMDTYFQKGYEIAKLERLKLLHPNLSSENSLGGFGDSLDDLVDSLNTNHGVS